MQIRRVIRRRLHDGSGEGGVHRVPYGPPRPRLKHVQSSSNKSDLAIILHARETSKKLGATSKGGRSWSDYFGGDCTHPIQPCLGAPSRGDDQHAAAAAGIPAG